MSTPEAKNYTISTLLAIFFIGIAVFFDATKLLLLLVSAVPLVGAPIGLLASWVDSMFEFILITVGLYLAGAYKGRNAMSNGLVTMGMGMIDLIPLINDFPTTTGAVIFIIITSRIGDKAEQLKNTKRNIVAAQKRQEQLRREKLQKEAAQRALQSRQA